MQRIGLLAAALTIGSFLAIQAGINAQLRQVLGSPFRSALLSVFVSTIFMLLIVVIAGQPTTTQPLRGAPWWFYTGGLLGACVVLGSLILAPRVGASTLSAGIICGQLVTALVLDHFGLVGFPIVRLSPSRILGAVLLFVALFLIRRR